MQSETTKIRLLVLALMNLSFLLLFSGSTSAQQAIEDNAIEDNIRPVGQVCLAGQSCVGSTVGRAAVAMPAAEIVAPAVEEVVEEIVAAVVEEVAPAVVEEVAPAVVEEEVAAEPAVVEEIVAAVAGFDVESTYQMTCFLCHGTGAAGAPMLGDQAVWSERMAKGINTVMGNVLNGLNAMPPAKSLCPTCSDDDLRALVDYMAAQ